MGEAFIINRDSGASGAKIIVKVKITDTTRYIECSSVENNVVYRKNITGSDQYLSFNATYGSWTVFLKEISDDSTVRSIALDIDILKEYNVDITGITYGIAIDEGNINPYNAVTYIDDAVGFTPVYIVDGNRFNYGSWEEAVSDFFGVRPCLIGMDSNSNPVILSYLNKDNYGLDESGNEIDLSSGDVMIEFKKTWYKWSKDGEILKFEVANYDRSADGFISYAFASANGNENASGSTVSSDGTTMHIKDHIYYGAYQSYLGKSLVGYLPTLSRYTTLNNSIKNGSGPNYTCESIILRQYIIGILMLLGKTRNLTETYGPGFWLANQASTASYLQAGTANQLGLFYGDTSSAGTNSVLKCLGIENLWGNGASWCSGLMIGSTTVLLLSMEGSDAIPISNSCTRGSYIIPISMSPAFDGSIILPTAGTGSISDVNIGYRNTSNISTVANYALYTGVDCYNDNSSTLASGPLSFYFSNPSSYQNPGKTFRVVCTIPD